MKKIIKLIAIIVAFQVTAHAAFDDLGVGARAPGLANAFVGVADNVDALYYNPAGLYQLDRDEISMQYGQLLRGTDSTSNTGTSYLGLAHPLWGGRYGVLGFGYNNFEATSLFSERTLILSYGWKQKVAPFDWPGIWSFGGNLKQLHRQYEPDRYTQNALNDVGGASNQVDPLFAAHGYTKDNYAVDAGALAHFGSRSQYSAGLTLMNINRPDVSLANDGDYAPFITKLGLAYRPRWGLITTEVRQAKRLQTSTDTDLAWGIERTFHTSTVGEFAIRGGYATGSRQYKQTTVGMSYQFQRTRLDYSFIIPTGNLSDSGGGHNLELSIRLGSENGENEPTLPTDFDLISTFDHDAHAAHAVLTRAVLDRNIPPEEKDLLLQLLVNKFPMDESTHLIQQDLVKLHHNKPYKLLDWPDLKSELVATIAAEDRLGAGDAIEHYTKGDDAYALSRMALLLPESKQDRVIAALCAIFHSEMAARAYRQRDIDATIEHVRQLHDQFPDDVVIDTAYRKLLLIRGHELEVLPQTTVPAAPVITPALPEAPVTLTAPQLVGAGEQPTKLTEKDALVKQFSTLLGYYYGRKAAGASENERRLLLEQIHSLYDGKGIDLTLVARELDAIQVPEKKAIPVVTLTPPVAISLAPFGSPTPIVVPSAVPTATSARKISVPNPVKKTAPAPRKAYKLSIKKPVAEIQASPELSTAMEYYKKAVQRGITDRERIEILESIIMKFGDAGEARVRKELERVKKRVEGQ